MIRWMVVDIVSHIPLCAATDSVLADYVMISRTTAYNILESYLVSYFARIEREEPVVFAMLPRRKPIGREIYYSYEPPKAFG